MPPRCARPWFYFLYNKNTYGPCAYYRIHNSNSSTTVSTPQELDELFNSKEMRVLRRAQAYGELEGSPCQYCVGSEGAHIPFSPFDNKHNDSFKRLLAKAQSAFQAGREVVDYHPLSFTFNSPHLCNLNCIMCDQGAPGISRKLMTTVNFDKIIGLMEQLAWENVGDITVTGGETFFTRESLDFFDALGRADTKGMMLTIASNGLLLERHTEILDRIDNLVLGFSVDGCGDLYESIRVGGKWADLLRNMRLIADMRATRPGWHVYLEPVLMRRNIPHMRKLISLARAFGFEFRCTPIRGNYLEENIFAFTHLLEGTDWEKRYDEAIAMAEPLYPSAAQVLKALKKGLHASMNRASGASYSISFAEKDQLLLQFFESHFAEKEFNIFGTSDNILYLLTNHPDIKNLKSVSDFTSKEGRYCGYDLVKPERLISDDAAIVIASNTFHTARYQTWVNENMPGRDVFIIPFWSTEVDDNMRDIAVRLGDHPVAAFGAGGSALTLLASSPLSALNITVFSDNDKRKWGQDVEGIPVVAPEDIPNHADMVVILSQGFEKPIYEQLSGLFGAKMSIIRPFTCNTSE